MNSNFIGVTDHHKKKLRKVLTSAIGLMVIGFLAVYLYKNQETFQSLKNIHWQQIVWIALLDMAAFFVNTVMNYFMLKRLEPRIGFWDCYGLQYVNSLLNKILPTVGAGAAYRAIFLKQKYQFSYSHFVSTLMGLYVINFVATPVIALICMGWIYLQTAAYNMPMILIYLVFLLGALAIILFSPKIPESSNRIIQTVKIITEDWNYIKKDYKLLLIAGFCFTALLFITAVQTMVSYQALGVQTHFIPMLLLSTTAIILQLLNFTPDAIGVKEGIFVFAGNLVQIPNALLVLGSLVVRAVSISTTLLFGSISHFLLHRKINNSDVIKDEPEVNTN